MSYPTGTAMIDAAKLIFGEKVENSLQAADWLALLNLAIRDVYLALPPEEMADFFNTVAVPVAGGKGTLPDLHKIIDVEIDGYPAHGIGREAFTVMARNPYSVPLVPVWAQNGETLYARDALNVNFSATVTFLPHPPYVTLAANEVILPVQQNVIIYLMVSHAYAQEEDLGQARHYRDLGFAIMRKTTPAGENQQAVEGGQEAAQ